MSSRLWRRILFLLISASLALSACRAAATEAVSTRTASPSSTLTSTVPATAAPTATAAEAVPTADDAYPGPEEVFPTQDAGAYPGVYPGPPTVDSGAYPGPGETFPTPAIGSGAYPGPGETFPTPTVGSGAYPGPGEQPSPFPSPTTGAYPGPSTATQAPFPTPAPGQASATPSPTGLLPTGSPLTPPPTGVIPTQQPTITPTRALPTVPQVTVDLRLLASDPEEFELASGEVQLVEFFTFWCFHCRAMIPILYGLEQEYDDDMNFVYLDLDDPRVREFREALKYRIPPGGIEPQFYLLDEEGEILKEWRGPVPLEEFEEEFDRALLPKQAP